MKTKTLLIILVLLFFSLLSFGNKLIKNSDSSKGLDANFNSVQKDVKGNKYIIYSIKVMMNENSHFGTIYSDSNEYINLGEFLTGKNYQPARSRNLSVKSAAKLALKSHKGEDDVNSKKSLREIGLIFRMDGEESSLSKISIRTYNSLIKLHDYPVYWLGEYNINESLSFLIKRFNTLKSTTFRKQLVTSIALHNVEKAVKPFLLKVIKGTYAKKVKEGAIFWIADYASPEVINSIYNIAKNNTEGMGKKAVFSLYRIKDKKADDLLIQLAKGADNIKVRENAIFWLGQKAIKRSAEVLGDIAKNDSEQSIQTKAVFSLSQLPGDSGIDRLINIAKSHKSFKVRKKAIFWLGQSSNPKGLKTIIDILKD